MGLGIIKKLIFQIGIYKNTNNFIRPGLVRISQKMRLMIREVD